MPLCLMWSKVYRLQQHMSGFMAFSTMRPKVAMIGIDFGCKNSRVAIIDSLVPKIVCGEIGSSLSSYVTVTKQSSVIPCGWALQQLDGFGKRVVVGELAKAKMLTEPSNVIFNIKNLIRKHIDDDYVQQLIQRVHFGITEGPKGEAWVEMHGKKISPIEMTRVIFSKLKDMVQMDQLHHYHALKAVISVPVFFNKMQREDIISAGTSAGLKILQIIDEPVAAALSSTTIKEGMVLVFGMGAGSYSISILHVSHTMQIARKYSVDITGDKFAMTILADAAEKVKVDLSTQLEAIVSIPYLTASAEGPVDINITISRFEFENLGANLLEQIQVKCQNILKQCGLTDKDIDEVVLMGGMTRVPKIQRIVSTVFGKHPVSKVKAEEAVVIGSAIQAALTVEDQTEICEGMIPLSIGIESAEGIFTRIIPRHITIPAKKTIKIPSWCAYGESLRIKIYLGEHVMVHNNILLGEVDLRNYGSSWQGPLNFELTFEVDKDYIVKVHTSLEGADNSKHTVLIIPFREKICKDKINMAVKNALLDWSMYTAETHARLKNCARYIMNNLEYVLITSKDELPKHHFDEAVKVLADLRMALSGDVNLLKVKVLQAQSVGSAIFCWMQS